MTSRPSENAYVGPGDAWSLLNAAARLASQAPDLTTALRDILEPLASHLACDRAWAVAFDGEEPRRAASWLRPGATPEEGASGDGWLWLTLDRLPAPEGASQLDAPLWIAPTSTLALPVTTAAAGIAAALVFAGGALEPPSPEARAALVQVGSHLARVAERERARAVLRRLEGDALSLMERAHEGILRYDAEGRISYVNARFAQLLGLPVDALLGADIASTDYVSGLAGGDRIARRREGPEQYETRLATADGSDVWVLASAAPMFAADGRYAGGLLFVSDISQRRTAEHDVRDLNAELETRVGERTAELEAANAELEAFAYSVSHDLRAPLRAVTGFAEILREEHRDALAPEAREYLDLITGNAERMGELIDDLLEFSRVGRTALRVEALDVGPLVEDAWRELESERQGRKVALIKDALPVGRADRRLLRLVWLNLLSNAVKFTRTREHAEIRVGGEVTAHEVRYSVRDNGVGFDMAHADQLFQVFQRLHRAEQFEGTGVGLAIVQRIVARHGGRVWADARPDGGACVTFALPLEEGGTPDV